MTDIENLVEGATDPKTFSVLDAAKGRSYPTDVCTVFTDVATAYEIKRLEAEAADATEAEDADRLDAQIKELREKVMQTAMQFHLRGFAPGVVENIQNQCRAEFKIDGEQPIPEGKAAEWVNFTYLAESIIKVVNADGAVDEHHWSREDVEQLKGLLAPSEFDRLSEAAFNLTFAAMYFDNVVSADF